MMGYKSDVATPHLTAKFAVNTTMTPSTYTRVVLAERPKGPINASTFNIIDAPFDLKPADDEALVKVEYLSIDPAMRLWLDENTYIHPMAIGDTMGAIGLGTVIEAGSNSGVFVGDQISGRIGTCDRRNFVLSHI